MAGLAFAAVLAGTWLFVSVNLAILLTRMVKGIDVRSIGPGTAGTANTARALGPGWAVVVFLFDLSKSMGPLWLWKTVAPPLPAAQLTASLFLVAAAAIVGHCRPPFHGFRGGGGVVTTMGAMFFFAPAELFVSLLAGFLVVQLFLRGARYRLGQWTPIAFLTLAPVVTFVAGRLGDLPLVAGLHVGGKPWPIAVGLLALGGLVLLLNPRHARDRARELRKRPRPDRTGAGSEVEKHVHHHEDRPGEDPH